MNKLLVKLLLATILLSLSACQGKNYAPVANGVAYPIGVPGNFHRVTYGETLYAIAWHYDMDYRKIAAINNLRPPYKLLVGQKLQLKTSPQRAVISRTSRISRFHPIVKRPVIHPLKVSRKPVTVKSSLPVSRWTWPARGKLIGRYSPANGYKGINIAGNKGQAIYAAAKGRVAYSGNGLRGYGNLIIIKHNDEFLSAYAHNDKNLVKEGQMVNSGQIIAEMGNTESSTTMLHFEIRKAGKSVNPLGYLR